MKKPATESVRNPIVPNVPANPKLTPECDRVWETREEEAKEEEEEEEVVVWEWQKKPGEKWSGVCAGVPCHLLSLHHNLWGRQPVREQEAEETVEVWLCVCVCVCEGRRWVGSLAARWAD